MSFLDPQQNSKSSEGNCQLVPVPHDCYLNTDLSRMPTHWVSLCLDRRTFTRFDENIFFKLTRSSHEKKSDEGFLNEHNLFQRIYPKMNLVRGETNLKNSLQSKAGTHKPAACS